VSQQVHIAGRYNTVVQIVGNGNAVVASHAHLELYLPPKVENPQGIELLDPKSRAIPFIGRDAELTALRAWLGSEKPVAVRMVTGGAGAGKTRLALHLCELARLDGWDAGFVDSAELTRFRSQQNLATWGWQRPTLIVIDYAALHAQQIQDWLRELGRRNRRDGKPLRLLLLERFAEPDRGWWQTAFGRGSFGLLAVQRMLDPPQPIPLTPMGADERRAIMDATLEQVGSSLRAPKGERAVFSRNLEGMGEPLFLMMAGLRAVDTGIADALSLNKTELALDLADRELERIERTAHAHGVTPAMLVHLAAYATLCRGLSRQATIEAAREEQAALGYDDASPPASLADSLVAALPGADGSIAPILPDLIGEAAILRALADAGVETEGTIERAFARTGQQVVATLIRTAQDFAGAGHDQPLAWLDALIERESVDVDQLMLVAGTLPERSFALMEHAARLTQKVVALLRDAVAAGESHRLPVLAIWLGNLGVRLSAVGQRQEALGPAREAADLYRELAAKAPDAYRPALASALNNLAIRLSEVGQRQEALGPAKEAVALRRDLAAKAPDAYRPDLASALNNLATILSAVGQRREALGPAKEAADLYRELAATAPDACRPDLAMALNNLAIRLSEVGQRQEALGPAKEAANLYRELAATAPDAYRPDLAMALTNLAIRLSEVGQRQEALEPAKEAANLYRELGAKAPDAYRPVLASALNNLANCLSEVGQRQEALGPSEEAVKIRRKLTAANPDAYEPDLATSLSNLAIRLSEVGQRQEAVDAAHEAVSMLARPFLALPEAYASWMMTVARNYLELCEEVGRKPDTELLGPIVEVLERMQAA
jgi:tetratricopeptide (TPR) repeat protein